ncbi:hypothetical protein IC582_007988 [Cucumis melo]
MDLAPDQDWNTIFNVKKDVENEVVKEEVNVDVIILNDLQEDAIEVRNEKEVVCESNIKMPQPLKTILRFVEKVMDKDSGIHYQLPFSLFGIGRKTCVLREYIIDFCNMREVKTLTLVAYMAVITIFRSQKNIQTSRKQPIWKTMKCPLQVGVVECGYYVMRYMRDIITNGSIVVTDLVSCV